MKRPALSSFRRRLARGALALVLAGGWARAQNWRACGNFAGGARLGGRRR